MEAVLYAPAETRTGEVTAAACNALAALSRVKLTVVTDPSKLPADLQGNICCSFAPTPALHVTAARCTVYGAGACVRTISRMCPESEMFGSDPEERAAVDQWLSVAQADVDTAIIGLTRYQSTGAPVLLERFQSVLVASLDALDAALTDTTFVATPARPSAADAVLFSILFSSATKLSQFSSLQLGAPPGPGSSRPALCRWASHMAYLSIFPLPQGLKPWGGVAGAPVAKKPQASSKAAPAPAAAAGSSKMKAGYLYLQTGEHKLEHPPIPKMESTIPAKLDTRVFEGPTPNSSMQGGYVTLSTKNNVLPPGAVVSPTVPASALAAAAASAAKGEPASLDFVSQPMPVAAGQLSIGDINAAAAPTRDDFISQPMPAAPGQFTTALIDSAAAPAGAATAQAAPVPKPQPAKAPAQQAKAKAAPKPKATNEQKKQKGEGKKGKKGKKDAKELTPEEKEKARAKLLKAVTKEGGKTGQDIIGVYEMGGLEFFCTTITTPEGDLELMNMCLDAMNKEIDPESEEKRGGAAPVGKMLFSAGVDQLGVLAKIPEEKTAKVNVGEWMKHVMEQIKGEVVGESTASYAQGVVKANKDLGIFPLKIKDDGISQAVLYLRSKGCFPEDDDDDDDECYGDDDFDDF